MFARYTVQLAILVVAVSAAACHSPAEPSRPDYDQLRRDVAAHRRVWEGHRIRSYDFEYQRLCWCAWEPPVGHVLLSVRCTELVRGQVLSGCVGDVGGGQSLPDDLLSAYPTVSELFDLLMDTIDQRLADGIHVI